MRKRQTSQRTVSLHDAQELNDDLRAGSDEHLALAALLGVIDGIERIVEDAGFDHLDYLRMRFSTRINRR